jgi:hypothetical protein
VANHQIRNLKALLVEDTVNFESHYHLDRLVRGKSRVDRKAAQKWWTSAALEFRPQCTTLPTFTPRSELEIFTRAVVASLFAKGGPCEVPDTFYLDHDRLRVLKSEIEDLIHFDICSDLFEQLLQEFGYSGPMTGATRKELRTALSAIVGEGEHHIAQSWVHHAGPISLEIYRQASVLTGRSPFQNLGYLQKAKHYLRDLFENTFVAHASALKATLLPQVLICANKHFNSSSNDLFNSLVLPTPPPPPQALGLIPTPPVDTSTPPYADKLVDLTNRITHIILLHWRIWGPIAYILDEEKPAPTHSYSQKRPYTTPQPSHSSLTLASPSPQSQQHVSHPLPLPCPSKVDDSDTQVVDLGAPPDPGEPPVPHETSMP